jgi:hypothetical protein
MDCHVIYPVEGIRFDAASGAVASQGVNSNHFIHISVQASSGYTYYGVNAISGRGNRNTWLDCTMWDLGGISGTHSAVFGADMMNQIIIGGAMTYQGFEAYGSGILSPEAYSSPHFDSDMAVRGILHAPIISNSGTTVLQFENRGSGQALTIYLYATSGFNNSSISWWGGRDQADRLLIQKTTINNFRSSRNTSAGTVRPTVFQMHDGVVGTTIEALQISTSGNVEFNRSGGTVQFNSGNTSLTRTNTASMSGTFAPLSFITARLGSLDVKVPYFAA